MPVFHVHHGIAGAKLGQCIGYGGKRNSVIFLMLGEVRPYGFETLLGSLTQGSLLGFQPA
jgi:hypothetical protein